MKLRYLQFAAVMLWGMQTDLLYFAVPMGILLEARHFTNRRWAFIKQDFFRIADLTSLTTVAVIILLFLNREHYHLVTTLVGWLPILLFPLVVVLGFSTTERMSLDVIFYSLRRQSQPVTQSWDMNAVFFGLCLVSAGVNTVDQRFYMIAVSLLVLIALFRSRSTRYQRHLWLLLACVVFISAWFTQQAIRIGHTALKEQTREWIANYIHARVNPLKTNSAIGSIGKLKLSDAIAFRVAPQSRATFPSLLQEATYDVYANDNWLVLNPGFKTMPHADNFTWRLAPKAPGEHRAYIYLTFYSDVDIVPVPADTTLISDLPAMDIRKSKYGSIEATGMVPGPGYRVSYAAGDDINGPPDSTDLVVPPAYKKILARVASTSSLPATAPIAKVRDILHDFRYSLYQDTPKSSDPIAHFLMVSKAGYCEYFATATVLLLRYMGVPARYAVGYSVQEYNPGLGMYIVRKRHAHAWAIAWWHHRWQVVDTTPAIWKTAESAEISRFRPVIDFIDNRVFAFRLWWSKQRLVDYRLELYFAGALLVLLLIWRVATSEQVTLDTARDAHEMTADPPGGDSPFYRITRQLEAMGLARQPGEAFSTWFARIDHTELMPLLQLHNRLRFDPRGLGKQDARRLTDGVARWLQSSSQVEV